MGYIVLPTKPFSTHVDQSEARPLTSEDIWGGKRVGKTHVFRL